MSAARTALDRGLDVLVGQFPDSFTVDGIPGRTFTGLIEESNKSNNPGLGGFIPQANAVLFVPNSQFSAVKFTPREGTRLRVHETDWSVTDVGRNPHRWRLTLAVSHPNVIVDV